MLAFSFELSKRADDVYMLGYMRIGDAQRRADNGSPEYKSMFERIEREGLVLEN